MDEGDFRLEISAIQLLSKVVCVSYLALHSCPMVFFLFRDIFVCIYIPQVLRFLMITKLPILQLMSASGHNHLPNITEKKDLDTSAVSVTLSAWTCISQLPH